MAMGLKLPEMPFCMGFAARTAGAGRKLETSERLRLVAGGIGGVAGLCCSSAAWWMLNMKALTGNPLFPYFNEYWRSPLALAAPYRDLRFVPTHFWRELFFPVLFSIDWHVADDLGFQDIRVCIAYVLVIAGDRDPVACARESRDPLFDKRVTLPSVRLCRGELFRLAAESSPSIATSSCSRCWRPLLIVAAVGLFPLAAPQPLSDPGRLVPSPSWSTARSDFLERAPVEDPYIQVALPPIPHPDQTMVLMTGDAPMGFIAALAAAADSRSCASTAGWCSPRDGTLLTRT